MVVVVVTVVVVLVVVLVVDLVVVLRGGGLVGMNGNSGFLLLSSMRSESTKPLKFCFDLSF